MPDADLPIVSPPPIERTLEGEDTRPAVAGVVLAAGTSSRFGEGNKLLARHDGRPLVEHTVETLLAAPVDPVVVVLGHEADRVVAALDGLPVECVENRAFAAGQATSLATGIDALAGRDVDAAVIALGDMPFVQPTTVSALVAAYADGAGDALAAAYRGERGNPVLFDRRHFPALRDVEGDVGGRHILLEGEHSALVDVDDPGVRRDVDEQGDL